MLVALSVRIVIRTLVGGRWKINLMGLIPLVVVLLGV